MYQGKEYDYVFDIEIDEPRTTLKLPYNVTEDPWMAAQTFIHKYVAVVAFARIYVEFKTIFCRHDLAQLYLDEIANHIVKNTIIYLHYVQK